MEDRELLELAAKTAGIRFRFEGAYPLRFVEYNESAEQEDWTDWNPLAPTPQGMGDAFLLRREVMRIWNRDHFSDFVDGLIDDIRHTELFGESIPEMQRAIVFAAAEIAKSNQEGNQQWTTSPNSSTPTPTADPTSRAS